MSLGAPLHSSYSLPQRMGGASWVVESASLLKHRVRLDLEGSSLKPVPRKTRCWQHHDKPVYWLRRTLPRAARSTTRFLVLAGALFEGFQGK